MISILLILVEEKKSKASKQANQFHKIHFDQITNKINCFIKYRINEFVIH